MKSKIKVRLIGDKIHAKLKEVKERVKERSRLRDIERY
jgi:hypothetical protein